MKKILLAALLFLAPVCAFAEKRVSVGFNLGLAPYTLPINNKSAFNSAFLKDRSDAQLYLSGNIFYNFNEKYQLGLQAGITAIDYKIEYYRLNSKPTNLKNYNILYSEEPIAGPAVPITVVFNRILNDNAVKFYTGVEAGYERYVIQNASQGKSISGTLGGVHIGGTYDMSRAVKLNANLAVDYHYSYTDNIHYKILSFPLTVGLIF